MTPLLWTLPAIACLILGWTTSAWFYRRRIKTLRNQINAVRQTASEHSNQARRQIGQLQAELAARPPKPMSVQERRAAANAARSAASDTHRSAPESNRHGFAATAVMPDGFHPTVISADGFADTHVIN